MIATLIFAVLVGCCHGIFFGPSTVDCGNNPVVNPLTGKTLDDVIIEIIKDTDNNTNGILDVDEVRTELLAKWGGPDNIVTESEFVNAFSVKYSEAPSVASQFFHSMDMTGDGVLTELDFILQILVLDPDFSGTVDKDEFRRFIHQMIAALVFAVLVVGSQGIFFGPSTPNCDNDPVVNAHTGFTLDDVIDDVLKDTDTNGDGLLDVDEVRKELLGRWAGGDDKVSETEFVHAFSVTYREDEAISRQFFHSMDMNGDGILEEIDFILQMLTLDPNLSGTVDKDEFRAFIHQHHPHGCA